MGEDEEATVRTLTAYRQVLASLIQQHRGRVVDSPGDILLTEFASVVDAVRRAVEIQRELKARNAGLPEARNPDLLVSYRALAVIYSESGRLEEARAEVAEVLRINPHYTLEGARKSLPFKDRARLERTLDLLRKAGLK